MKSIESIGLEEKDFDLIVDALEHLPSKDLAGEMFSAVLMSALIDDTEELDRMKLKQEKDQRTKQRKKDLLVEEIRILQGKLISLKRILVEKNLMNDVKEIIT